MKSYTVKINKIVLEEYTVKVPSESAEEAEKFVKENLQNVLSISLLTSKENASVTVHVVEE